MPHAKALELHGIVKAFDGRPALVDASFDVAWGEVHALLGENGAGKSTLMNVVCGLYAPDEGSVIVDGSPATITKPSDAIALRIGMVHQHFKLVDGFTVAENVFLFCSAALGVSSPAGASAAVRDKANQLGLDVDPDAVIADVSIAERQRVEIVKMLLAGARILILDEPTAVLTDSESESVLALLRQMARGGCAVVLITHKLREVLGYSDRVSVMRRGRSVLTGARTSRMTRRELAVAMVGESSEDSPSRMSVAGDDRYVVHGLEVANIAGGVGVDGVSFRVRAGEIYGIAGVGGNGQPQLADALMGLCAPDSGTVTIDGIDISNAGVLERRRRGLRFIPADRFGSGLVADLQAYENFGITGLRDHHFGSWLAVDRSAMKSAASRAIIEHNIQGCVPATRAGLLSGGNAQKLLLARELDTALTVLIAHSPTRGLDVQACNAVHRAIVGAAANGAACLLISEDLEEILRISMTIAVMSRGRIVGEFPAASASRERIGALMLGHA